MKNFQFFLSGTICLAVLSGFGFSDSLAQSRATAVDLENLEFTVEEAPEWTELFYRSSGWFGGDGIFAIPLDGKRYVKSSPDTKSLFIFSDTLIGEITDGDLQPGWKMVNNSVAYLQGSEPDEDAITFHWDKTATEGQYPGTLFVPETSRAKEKDYYWLADGFMNAALDSTIYFFSYRMWNDETITEGWNFVLQETGLIALPKGSTPPFDDHRQIEFPISGIVGGVFPNTETSGAPDPDGYVYIYGNRGGLTVARVLPEDFETFGEWRFWNGEEWTPDSQQVAVVASNVSNELSVSPLPDGRYALVFTHDGTESPTVGLRIGATPYGPFGPEIAVYESREKEWGSLFAYNAKAHPNLSAPGELLISYNVNSYDFREDMKTDPNLYHPRFIKIILE